MSVTRPGITDQLEALQQKLARELQCDERVSRVGSLSSRPPTSLTGPASPSSFSITHGHSPRRRPPALSLDSIHSDSASNFGPRSSGHSNRPASHRREQSLDFTASRQLGLNISPAVTRRGHSEDRLRDTIKNNASKLVFEDGESYTHVSTSDLEKIGDLGTGTCANVVKMIHKPSKRVMAVKQMRKSGVFEENRRIYMDLEVVLKCSSCPNIVHCYGYFVTDSEVWICMQLMDTCLEKLQKNRGQRPIPEDVLGSITVSVVKALHYLKKEHGVIHRDVKPSNILLDESGYVKLCDFGIAGHLENSKAKTRQAGVAGYIAPERIDLQEGHKYDIRADVWSLGITLVELATGRFPYANCTTDFELLAMVVEKDPPRLDPAKFSLEFCDFVASCLTKDYKLRPKYEKLLKDPFFKKHEKNDVSVIADWYFDVRRSLRTGGSQATSGSGLGNLLHNFPNGLRTSTNTAPFL